ncbi:type II secretion system protein [Coraliomargarita sp. SDUM461004]|uniref:Type II secretion system protein n=1 Tax=Thalassobacterium sedimentorum TaxID=3041258 RepID=A0ABU1AEP2_9BACT|nr:type II secretion system protein [Coraliomargarita sp. SDUM461004]MDQ8192979.1 type II secretion system protein [Coraliomargarita sp. SDUM461004]
MPVNTLQRKPATAFTLIELLVVIAVIAILASILMTSLGRVSEKALLTTSLSNIRELHAANTMYANDNGGHYVPIASRDNNGTLLRWLENDQYRAFLGLQEDQEWPDDLFSPNANVLDSHGKPRFDRSYAMNITGLTGYSTPGNLWQLSVYKVDEPAKTIAMTDALDWIVSYYGTKKYTGVEVSSGSTVAYRYSGKAAVIYYDGHTAAHTMEEISDKSEAWFLDN